MKTHVSTVDFAAENFDFFAGQNIITWSAATKVLVLLVYDPFASKKERYKMVLKLQNETGHLFLQTCHANHFGCRDVQSVSWQSIAVCGCVLNPDSMEQPHFHSCFIVH